MGQQRNWSEKIGDENILKIFFSLCLSVRVTVLCLGQFSSAMKVTYITASILPLYSVYFILGRNISYFLFIYNLNQQSEFTFYKLMLWLLQCLDGESSSGEFPVPQIRSIGQFLLSCLFSSLNSSVLRSGFSWVWSLVWWLLHFLCMTSCTYNMCTGNKLLSKHTSQRKANCPYFDKDIQPQSQLITAINNVTIVYLILFLKPWKHLITLVGVQFTYYTFQNWEIINACLHYISVPRNTGWNH
jgi:hypothetical protein